ncbi:MAG: ATP-binding cassette domain-containing protein [Anaerolineae bacterium]|nr:ATP-binding cassette domain-containing protein [Anaerolineae bacterium]
MIHLRDVAYTYPGQPSPALADVALDIPDGSLTLVVGPSGEGKSTLLRTLNGLVPHFYGGCFTGSVRVMGVDPIALTPRRMGRHVGFVFQDPESQFVVSRVEDELAFGMENFGVAPPVMAERIAWGLGALGIGHLRDRRIETLSGGEKQRVAIAAALTLQPDMLVLDEPTSQLDPLGAADVLAALDDLHQRVGLSVVVAEHRVERMVASASHVLTVSGGRVAWGLPRDRLAGHPLAPPVTRLAAALGWYPTPLTLAEARPLVAHDSRLRNAIPRGSANGAAAGDAVLDIRDLHFEYPGLTALRGVDLTVAEGEVVALMGPNGAGKTTLLKLAMGLLKPRQGLVRIESEIVRGGDTARLARRVAYVPQDPGALLFADRVRDEVSFTRRAQGLAGEGDILARLNLTALADAYPRDLSVGQRQRVALAAVLAAEPRLVLLDEPTRGLDTGQKSDLADFLRGQARQGRGVLLTTHDVEMAAAAADRIVVLEAGQVVDAGLTADVMRRQPTLASQVAQLFPGSGWLTPSDVTRAIAARSPRTEAAA